MTRVEQLDVRLVGDAFTMRPEIKAALRSLRPRNGARVALRRWMEQHTGKRVATLQAKWVRGQVTSAWYAPDREVQTITSTYVILGGSRRHFHGVTCVAAHGHAWLGWDDDMDTYVLYFEVDDAHT